MVSEKKKLSNRKWDKDNMRSVSCRLRTEDAEQFKEYCKENGTTPAHFLKEYIIKTLAEYYGSGGSDKS
ncbi:MAG: hypothetical protein J1F11_09485 [Oscillospiraceae bacterium]|nr:hypothetical protein [Oscillospiraceae bacterium]